MSIDSYQRIYRQVLLRCPAVGTFNAQLFIQHAFRQLCQRRLWSFQTKRAQFIMNAQYNTGTVSVVLNSDTVVGVGTTFTGAMVGRQFRIGLNTPIYTIIAVPDATTLTLSEVWGAASASAQGYRIYNAYVTVPADFQSFISVYDPQMNWQLWTQVQQEYLNIYDAQRASTGTSYLLSPIDYSTLDSPPLPRYEVWPHQTAQYVYPYLYVARMADLDDSGATLPREVNGDLLLEMALAECARWPGASVESPNPYFNLTLALQHDRRAETILQQVERLDDEISQTSVWYGQLDSIPFAPLPWASASFMQSHALY